MDRFGLFVDAGYLLAAGGELCVGQKKRSKFFCDCEAVHERLVSFCAEHSKLPPLRTYWYDGGYGSPHPQPTSEQLRIAALSRVKLRLGRVIHGQQKGVDSMITRDLMTLARERAMPIAYLLSGDEDLREAVVAAQDLGVQVVLLGITPIAGLTNQSFTLVNECDARQLLDKEFLSPFFSLAPIESKVQAEPLLAPIVNIMPERSVEEAADELGRTYCDSWFGRVGGDVALLVFSRAPMVPADVDASLLRHAESVFGSLRSREELRKRIRQAFVARLTEKVHELNA